MKISEVYLIKDIMQIVAFNCCMFAVLSLCYFLCLLSSWNLEIIIMDVFMKISSFFVVSSLRLHHIAGEDVLVKGVLAELDLIIKTF